MGQRLRRIRGRFDRRAVSLALILLLGALMRFAELGSARHSHDDAYPSYQAVRMLNTATPALVGQPSSIFLDNPPLMAYLQVLPLLVAKSPWAIYLTVVGLNSAAIWFAYDLTRTLAGTRAARLAALLFAVNPWVVHFSRATWVQALLPLLVTVCCWGVWPYLTGKLRSDRRIIAGLLAAGTMMLTYVQAFGAVIQLGAAGILFHRRVPLRVRWTASAVLIVVLLLYGAGLVSEPSRNLAKLSGLFEQGTAPALTSAGLEHAARLVTGRDFAEAWAGEGTLAYQGRRVAGAVVSAALRIALVAGFLSALVDICNRNSRREVSGVLLAWFVIPVALTSFTAGPVHIHYLLLTLPAGTVLAARGLALLDRRGTRWLVVLLAASATLLAAVDLHAANRAAWEGRLNDDFKDWPLAASGRVGATVRDYLERAMGGAGSPRIAAEGDTTIWSSLTATYVEPLRGTDYPAFVVIPHADPLLYILKRDDGSTPLPRPEMELLDDHTERFPNGAAVFFLHTRSGATEALTGSGYTTVRWPSDVGLSLLSYHVQGMPDAAEPLQLTVVWRVIELLPERNEAFLTGVYRLVGPGGEILASAATHGQWGYRWRVGDHYVERTTLGTSGAPGRDVRLQIGLFDPIHNRVHALSSPEGWKPEYSAPLSQILAP